MLSIGFQYTPVLSMATWLDSVSLWRTFESLLRLPSFIHSQQTSHDHLFLSTSSPQQHGYMILPSVKQRTGTPLVLRFSQACCPVGRNGRRCLRCPDPTFFQALVHYKKDRSVVVAASRSNPTIFMRGDEPSFMKNFLFSPPVRFVGKCFAPGCPTNGDPPSSRC